AKALLLATAGHNEEALDCYDKLVAATPGNADAWINRARILNALLRHTDALACLENAFRIAPLRADIFLYCSAILRTLGRHKQALETCDKAIALDDNLADAWSHKGDLLHDTGQHDAALNAYARAIETQPENPDFWVNKGVVLNDLKRHEEALKCFDIALSYKPNHADAWCNKGNALNGLSRHSDALPCYAKALETSPDYADVHWNESLTRLTLGDFETGWRKYEARWTRKKADKYRYAEIAPLRDLRDAIGKKVLVWAEQGLGDTLQFCRYVPALVSAGTDVIFAAQSRLKDLMALNMRCPVIDINDNGIDANYQIPLLSLPLLFNATPASIPGQVPYLKPEMELVEAWRQRLDLSPDRLNVVIACSGNAQQTNDINRSMPLEMFDPLCKFCRLFLIQKDIRETDQSYLAQQPEVRHVGQLVTDFSNMAAVVENMDLVISVDSSPVHLAGALGKKLYVLLPWATEWRWMQDRNDSPWYPTACLFRQPRAGDWHSVIGNVAAELAKISNRTPHFR
ncbi:MAG TPA: tetratricopeptide repeat-containing glycosyltransferase family protein, partial [Rhodocyclaceae bacterium]|nr:tetratricopeptide repeat-containing glycosyltransferase family protein [Rhodocyclaceae bacterium]